MREGPASGPREGAARPTERWVWRDGSLGREGEVTLPTLDPAAREPEGLFETIRVSGGAPLLWSRHHRRLASSARELGFAAVPFAAALEAAMARLLEAARLSDAVVRITVARAGGPGWWVEAEPLEARLWPSTRRGGASAVFASRPFEPDSLGRHKTTSRAPYTQARDEARARGADEALLISPRGHVLEGTVTNVFAVVGGEIITPPLAAGILPGVARDWVLETCRAREIECREEPIPRDRLMTADEVFLTNAVQGVAPLALLEGRTVPGMAMGRKLMEAREGSLLPAGAPRIRISLPGAASDAPS